MPVEVQQPQTAQPPQPPQVLQVVPSPEGGVRVIRSGPTGSPSATYEAYRHQRSELRNQLERLEEQRDNIAGELRRPGAVDIDKKGLEQRIASIDQRITETEKQIADADASVARAAAVPGAVVPPPPHVDRGPPEEFFVLTGLFMFIVILPLTIAYARRIWRRGAAVVSAIPQEIYDRFNRLDQAVDSVAIEVERIGEGQRFLTRTFAEQRGLGAGPAERVESQEREKERQRRG
ncbi:MAG: hypothetical protein WD825_00510 [Gemmatimonadaceae bacterium]